MYCRILMQCNGRQIAVTSGGGAILEGVHLTTLLLLLLFVHVCCLMPAYVLPVAHFLRILAFMSRVQGQGHVWFAGGWTFVDAHEFAIISGLAAAERLGAGYPFADNKAAADIYRAYMAAVHGRKQPGVVQVTV